MTNQHFLSAMGKYAVDDPAKLDRLALANLRENKQARNNLASLQAARSCLYGSRGLGDKKWFVDKPGVAARLKTQAQRRQFRMGLVANVNFFNRLNLLDFNSLLTSGTSSDLALVRTDSVMTFSQFQNVVRRLSPIQLLRLFSPDKARQVSEALSEMSAVADYEQSLCNHMAANAALEPVHAVLGRLLRTGANFKTALTYNPIQLAAQALAPLCYGSDVDGLLTSSKNRGLSSRPKARSITNASTSYPRGVCFDFQRNKCTRINCRYPHRCASCRSSAHGQMSCPSQSSQGNATSPL